MFQITDGHDGVKDSRIIFVNDGKFITTGYDQVSGYTCQSVR